MEKVKTFDDLCLDNLRDIYDCEHQIAKVLPTITDAATSANLKKAFVSHQKQTEEHIARLEQVFDLMGEKPTRKACKATKGLLAEGVQHISEIQKGALLDAALIEGMQKMEHYEIASYGTIRAFATRAGKSDVAHLLDETLKDAEATDRLLTEIAETIVNREAASKQ